MARLHATSDSEDELPELSIVFGMVKTHQKKLESKNDTERKVPPETKRSASSRSVLESPRSVSKASYGDKQAKIQKPLGLAHVNSLLLPKVIPSTKSPTKANPASLNDGKSTNLKDSSKSFSARKARIKALAAGFRDIFEPTEEDSSYDDLSDFIVTDSASDEELKRPRPVRRLTNRSPKKTQEGKAYERDTDTLRIQRQLQQPPIIIDLISPDTASNTTTTKQIRSVSSEHILQDALLDDQDSSLKL